MSAYGNPRQAVRKLNAVGGAAIFIAVGGFIGWSASTDIAGAVIAPGTVVEQSSTKKVQHLSGGIVKEILVKEGSAVEAGQVLLRLDDTLPRSTLGVVQAQLDLYAARAARLVAERDGAATIAFPPRSADGREPPESATAGELRLFLSRHDSRAGQHGRLRERVAQTNEEVRGLLAQQRSKEAEIGYVGEELSSVTQLYDKHLVSLARLKQLQRDQARLGGERGQLVADIAGARRKIAETELQILQLDEDFRTDVLKELRETEAKIAELRERATAAADELAHTDIRAPYAGIVYQLRVHTIGGVIGKAETVMEIAPRADPLIVAAKIAPQDIDQVETGASVRIRIAAGNRRTTPELDGRVDVVSPDVEHDPPVTAGGADPAVEQRYYTALVKLGGTDAAATGGLQLLPGMPAEVYIRTQDRTPLDYLLKPLREQIAHSFRER